MGQHDILEEQLMQHIVLLQEGRRRAVLEPGAALVHPTGEQGCNCQRQHDGEQLAQKTRNAHGLATSSNRIRVRKLYIK